MLTVSENELFRFCLSLLSLHLRASAFLLPPSLTISLRSPFFTLISQYIVFVSLFLSLSLSLILSLFAASLLTLCVYIRLSSHPPSVIVLRSFSSLPHFLPPPRLGPNRPPPLSPGRSLSALVEPFVLPSSVT